jgi:electron transfer flavoprotein alpha subunit
MDFSYLDSLIEEEVGAEEVPETGTGYRHVMAVVEAAGGTLDPTAAQVLGAARDLADQIGVYVYGVLLGDGVTGAGDQLAAYGADKVFVVDNPALAEYQPKPYVQALAAAINQVRPEIVLMAATPLGNDLAPAVAQRLSTGLISHCLKLDLDMSERLMLGSYGVLGNDVYYTLACPEARPQMATLEPGYFREPYRDANRSADVQAVDVELEEEAGRLTWQDLNATIELPAVPLRKARVIVSAGRGMVDAEGFNLVEELAAALGGVVAGTRGALDEGWIGEEQVVGVGGESVAPDLYVACGLSGDIHHYFGMQKAKFVVAINPDEQAPIMKAANLAVVGDARQVIPAMLQAIRG